MGAHEGGTAFHEDAESMIRAVAGQIERFLIPIILIAAAWGLMAPHHFMWLKPYLSLLLGFVMFGIGLTIRTEQLKSLMTRPVVTLFGLGKFIFMPLLAFGIGLALQLPQEVLLGMVILGACPGGVAANVMSYLAKSNTALTVLLTILTTLLSPVLTPLIIYLFFHQQITIDMSAMVEKLFWVVLFPLVDAIVLRRFFMKAVEKTEWVFPPVSMLMVAVIVGFVTAANHTTLLDHPWLVLIAVLLFNLGGYAIGYGFARLLKFEKKICQSVAFEYGIQDSALGILIATNFFTALAALPSAICSLVQNLTGPSLAKNLN